MSGSPGRCAPQGPAAQHSKESSPIRVLGIPVGGDLPGPHGLPIRHGEVTSNGRYYGMFHLPTIHLIYMLILG